VNGQREPKGNSVMTRKYLHALGPSLIVGAGILVGTFVAVHAGESRAWVLAGPLLLALAVVGADVLGSRLHGESAGVSAAALIVAAAIPLASLIVMSRDSTLVGTLIPMMGAAAWVALLRPQHPRTPCSRI